MRIHSVTGRTSGLTKFWIKMVLVILGLIVIFIATAIIYARWNYGTLESTGVPVVPPRFILGSDPGMHTQILQDVDLQRRAKYGPIWGAYEGRAPHLFIADADLLRAILVRDFEHFHNRRSLDFGNPYFFETLDVLPYKKWRTVRHSLTPTFTTGKIRMMSEAMKESVVDCLANLNRICGEADSVDLNAKRVFVAVTMDIIARCAFGLKLDSVNDPNSPFVKNLAILTQDDFNPTSSLAWTLTFQLPLLTKIAPIFPPEAIEYFAVIVRKVMRERKALGDHGSDMIHIFNELVEKANTSEFQKIGITEMTAISQSLMFLFAGFDTLATTMTMLCYFLAKHPDKQEKLLEEVDDFLAKHGGDIDHDTQKGLPYLNACISEALRLRPPAVRAERICVKDWKDEETGLVIKKGTVVQFPMWAIHRDEKYWSEPEEFKPERFLPENKDKINQYAYLPFGHGPRNCVGMRFAKEEMNMVMVKILKEFRFEALPETKIVYKPGRQFLTQYEPIKMRFCRRRQM